MWTEEKVIETGRTDFNPLIATLVGFISTMGFIILLLNQLM